MADSQDEPLSQNTLAGALRTDPSELTRLALSREIAALREILEQRIQGDLRVLETRLDAMDTAIQLARKATDDCPTQMDEKVSQLRHLIMGHFGVVDERFKGIDTQFLERDQRVRDSRAADAAALAAALQAAKEAVGEANKAFGVSIDKSERATSEQIKQQRDLAETNFRAISDKIDALEKRVTRSEGVDFGKVREVTTRQDSGRFMMAIVGAIVGVAGLMVGVVLALVK